MTRQKHLKTLIRARMDKTGERYAAARRHFVTAPPDPDEAGTGGVTAAHRPGSVPAATALRIALAAAGTHGPNGTALSEAMVFGLCGGIGIGVFSFLYEKENFASLFLGGRHLWQDEDAYFRRAAARLGAAVDVRETTSAKAAEAALRAMLESGRPAIAFVEAGLLPHRAAPPERLGGDLRPIVVYAVDGDRGTATIGDLGDVSTDVPLAALAAARARIKKSKHRLLAITSAPERIDLARMIGDALSACAAGLDGADAIGGSKRNFSLVAIADLAERLGGTGKQSWSVIYPPGRRLHLGLTMMFEFIELAGTGGGLCRPLFAEFLREAGAALHRDDLRSLATGYAALGEMWTDLAYAALPDHVPELRDVRDAMIRRAELRAGPLTAATIAEIDGLTRELNEAEARAATAYPLDRARADALCAGLGDRVAAIHAREVELHRKLIAAAGG